MHRLHCLPNRGKGKLSSVTLLLLLSFCSPAETVVTFDDGLPSSASDVSPQFYQGLFWSNLAVLYVPNLQLDPTNGFYYGIVSAPYVAYNQHGNPSQIY